MAEYTYDSNNNRSKESLNNGQYEVQYTYNAANLITGMINKRVPDNSTLSSYSYTYSLDGNRLSENTKTYSYDAAGRLKAASQNGVTYNYSYDRRGNRSGMQVTANGQSANTSYTYSLNNELLQETKSLGVDPVSTTWYTYDARGNLLSSTVDEYSNAEAGAAAGITGAVLGESETSGAEVYEYDVFGKMEQIQKGNQTIRYGYNADGQRISKTVNSQRTEYIWDGDNIVSEKTGESAATYYQRGLGLIASAQGDEYYRDFYFKNAHGDVTGVYYAGNNSQKASYEYDPFGKQIDPNAAGEELLSGSYEGDPNDSNPYRYAGEYYDRETGSIYLRANNPILYIDPYGLDGIPPDAHMVWTEEDWLNYNRYFDPEFDMSFLTTTDPITVLETETTITIYAYVYIEGDIVDEIIPGENPNGITYRQAAIEGIEENWSGTYNDKTVIVEIVDLNDGNRYYTKAGQKSYTIEISSEDGTCRASPANSGGRMWLHQLQIPYENVVDKNGTVTTWGFKDVAAHEFGHALGLGHSKRGTHSIFWGAGHATDIDYKYMLETYNTNKWYNDNWPEE